MADDYFESDLHPSACANSDELMLRTLLSERERTHGRFAESAAVAQATKVIWRDRRGTLVDAQREVLDAIAGKVARILCGDSCHADHWRDIAGYAMLVVRELERE